jgi:hypothetical protein
MIYKEASPILTKFSMMVEDSSGEVSAIENPNFLSSSILQKFGTPLPTKVYAYYPRTIRPNILRIYAFNRAWGGGGG